MVAFLDIRGAFDNVNIAFTSNALLERGFDPHMVEWYSHYLGNRVVTATVRGTSLCRLLRRGFLGEVYSARLPGTVT